MYSMSAPQKINQEECLKLYNQGVPQSALATMYDVTRGAVHQLITRLQGDTKVLELFTENEGRALDNIRATMLSKLTDRLPNISIDTAKEYQLMATAYAIIYDKSRLQAGLSTGNYSIMSHSKAVDEAAIMKQHIEKLQNDFENSTQEQ